MVGCQETEKTKTKKKTPSLSSFTQENRVKPNNSNNNNNNNNTKKTQQFNTKRLKILHLFPTHIFNFLFLMFSQQPKKKKKTVNKSIKTHNFFQYPKEKRKRKTQKG